MQMKPVVDGIEQDLADSAKVVRVELSTDLGRELGKRYEVEFVPTFLVFDARGGLVRIDHRVDRASVAAELRALARR